MKIYIYLFWLRIRTKFTDTTLSNATLENIQKVKYLSL